MPQIKSEHRGAMVQFLKGRGITHEQEQIAPDTLKPSQAEYSPAKVERARGFDGTPRSLLVSSDDHVIDGHHQWLAALNDAPAQPIPVIRLHAPAHQLLIETARFPSSGVDETSANNSTGGTPAGDAPMDPPAPSDPLDELLRTVPDAPHAARAVAAAPPAAPHSSFVLERDAPQIKEAFRAQFGHDLPVSAYGQTEFHRRLGRDHSANLDVALSPNSEAGKWLTGYLAQNNIPFIPMYHAGQMASGPHIHVGLQSRKLDALDSVLDQVPAAASSPDPAVASSPAPAGDALDNLMADVPAADPDSIGVVNSAHATAPTVAAPSPQTFDPYTTEGRAARDAQAQAESTPSAMREIAVTLPQEYSKLSPRDVGELAVKQYARSEGIPDDFASAWLAKHPEVGLYHLRHDVGDGQPEPFYLSPAFDPATRTLHVGAQMPQLSQLKREYEASRNLPERGADWLLDDSRTAGEKAGDVASAGAHALDVVTRPLQAASTAVAGQQRLAGALIASPFSESAREVVKSGLYSPETQIAAALHKLKTGETPAGYEQPVAEGLDLLSQLYRREPLNPLVKEAVALGFDPVNYVPLEGVNELGASGLSRLSRAASQTRAGQLYERAFRALSEAHDPHVEEVFNSGGRVLELHPDPKDPENLFVTMQAGDGSTVRVNTATGEYEKVGNAPPPAPETPETPAAQVEAIKNGRRAVVHVEPDAINDPAQKVVVPNGMRSFGTPEGGRIIYNPELVAREEVARRMDDGTLGELMGNVEPQPKEPAGDALDELLQDVPPSSAAMPAKEPWQMSRDELERAAEGGRIAPFGDGKGHSEGLRPGTEEWKSIKDGRRPFGIEAETTDGSGKFVDNIRNKVERWARRDGLAVSFSDPGNWAVARDQETADRAAQEIAALDRNDPSFHAKQGRLLGYSDADIARYYLNRMDEGLHPSAAGDELDQLLSDVPSAPARGVVSRAASTASDIINLPKSIKNSFALHGPFRQGVFQAAAHPTFLKDAIATQAKAFASEPAYQDFVRGLMDRPDFQDLKEFLFLPSVRDVEFAGHAPVGLREEGFASAAAEKIPGVRRSSRGYMAAMDSLRVQAWDSYMADLAGNPNVNRETLKALGELVNITTGRGVVPVLDRSAMGKKIVTLLNNPLWSPRAMAARFNQLSPYRILENAINPATRPVALLQLRDSTRALATVGTTMALLSQVPGVKVGLNPYKPDWGKVVIGNTRYDLIDGVPATARYVAQMSRAFYDQAAGKKAPAWQEPAELTKDFLRRRLSPTAAVAANAYTGKTLEGQPFTYSGAARDLALPFVVDGLYQGWLDAGGSGVGDVVTGKPVKTAFKGAAHGLPSVIGIPASTYKSRVPQRFQTSVPQRRDIQSVESREP
jgi:hypothetical protein